MHLKVKLNKKVKIENKLKWIFVSNAQHVTCQRQVESYQNNIKLDLVI